MGSHDRFASTRFPAFLGFISLCGFFKNWHADCLNENSRITSGKNNNTTK